MQSYAIKLKNALPGLSFYIFLHILQPYNFPHAATPPSTTFTNAKIPARDSFLNLRAGISYSYLPAYLFEAWYSVIYPVLDI